MAMKTFEFYNTLHFKKDGWQFLSYDRNPDLDNPTVGFLLRDAGQIPNHHRLEILYWRPDRAQDDTQLVLDGETGNLGIGAANPTDKLTIRGALAFQPAGQDQPDQSEMGIDYDAASQSLRIRTRKAPATALSDDLLTIKQDGEITAKGKLNATGGLAVTGSLSAQSITADSLTAPTVTASTEVSVGSTKLTSESISGKELIAANTVKTNSLQANGANQNLTIASAGTGALLLNSAGGNVGIGVSPSSARLEVNGTVKATAFAGSGAQLTAINATSITEGVLAVERVPSLTNLTGDLPIARTSGDLPITRTTGVLPAARVDGVFSQWTTNGSAIHYNGNVGIGTQGEGDGKLEIKGSSKDAIVKFGGKNGDVNHLSSLLSMFFNSVGGEYYFRKIEVFGDLGKFTDLMSIRSDGLHVNQNLQVDGGISCSGKITNPMWRVSQPIANVPGGLPKGNNFVTGGGTLLLLVSGSGRLDAGIGILGMEIWIDNIKRGEAKVCTNTQYAHCAFVSTPLVVTGLMRGTHQIRLDPLTPVPYSTVTDGNDFFNVTILEFPF